MRVLAVAVFAGVLLGGETSIWASDVGAQAVPSASCPAGDRRGAAMIRKLLSSEPSAALRWAAESARLRHVPVRPLADMADQEACARLNDFVTPAVTEDPLVTRSYYALDAYYIVVLRRAPGAGGQRSEFSPVIILNRDLKPVEVLGM